MIARCIKSSCEPKGIVLDPFCGTATSLVACERICSVRGFGIEIDPRWVACSLERLSQMSLEPKLVK